MNLAERLRSLCEARGLTQKQLAAQLGLAPSAVCAYENGSRQPSYDVLIHLTRLAALLRDKK